MYLPLNKAETVLKLLLEGMAVNAVERLTGVHHTTILKLLVLAGEKCERIMAEKIRGIEVRDVECDEVWAFIGKKQKRVRADDDPSLGDCYTFVAIERHAKLVLNIAIGKRDQATTDVFIEGLRHATTADQYQITTDGFSPYDDSSASVCDWHVYLPAVICFGAISDSPLLFGISSGPACVAGPGRSGLNGYGLFLRTCAALMPNPSKPPAKT